MKHVALLIVLLAACSRAQLDDDVFLEVPSATPDAGMAQESTGALEAPRNVRASTDLPDRIDVTFEAPSSGEPSSYRVLRDGAVIATLAADARGHRDLEVAKGDLGPPGLVQASQGTYADRVELRWSAPRDAQPGPTHYYTVVALQGGRLSRPSAPAAGRRAAPVITHYEVSVDQERTWTALPGQTTSYTHADAPSAIVEPGEVFLKALFAPAGAVRLEVHDAAQARGDVFYRVRAVSAQGPGESSEATLGYRAFHSRPLRYQWQRSVAGDPQRFEDLPGVTGPSWFDASLPPNTERNYRVRVSTDSSASAVSAAVRIRTQPKVVDAAGDHSARCVITEENQLRCWNTRAVHEPSTDFKQVSTAYGRICALALDGRMSCWGGAGDTYTPRGPSATSYRQISLSGGSTCFIRADDQQVECRSFYPYAAAPAGRFDMIRTADDGVCGLRTDGKLVCSFKDASPALGPTAERFIAMHHVNGRTWAVDVEGRLMVWHHSDSAMTPLGAESKRFVDTTAECARESDGKLWCWPFGLHADPLVVTDRSYEKLLGNCGIRTDGRLDCERELWSSPLPPSASGVGLAMLNDQACLLGSGGEVICPDISSRLATIPESERRAHVRALVERLSIQTCALYDDGVFKCWENGAWYGEPLPDLPQDERFSSVAGGRQLICGIRLDGRLRCVLGAQIELPPPSLSEQRFVEIAAGFNHVCALDAHRMLTCWGEGSVAHPPVHATERPIVALAVGDRHACVVRDDHQRMCWGQAPTELQDTTLIALAAGYSHTCGLTAEGSVECWGAVQAWTPPTSLGRYTAIQAHNGDTCALRDDGKLVCWGASHRAQDGLPLVTP